MLKVLYHCQDNSFMSTGGVKGAVSLSGEQFYEYRWC